MPDPKNKTLKVALPAELYEQLEKAAAADDRELDRFVTRMIRQYLSGMVPVSQVPGAILFPQRAAIGSGIAAAEKTAEQLFDEAKGKASAFAMKPGMPGTPALIESDPLSGQTVESVRPKVAPRLAPPGQENLFPAHK